MGHAFQIKQHDRLPVVGVYLEQETGDPVPSLAAASRINFHMRATGAASYLVSGQATLISASLGEVEYHWQAGETATAGLFQYEFEVLWAGSKLQTVPNQGYEPLRVVDDIA